MRGPSDHVMPDVRIEPLKPEQTGEAAHLLARAFVTNPLHAAAFGPSPIVANEAFFRIGLAAMKGPTLVAVDGSRILGLIHWVHSPGCQLTGLGKLRIMPKMVKGLGVASALKVSVWLSAWARHDPGDGHVHLGPIGVEPEAQGRHIGHRLMDRYCEELDRTRTAGYLETDRLENVGFYKRSGFEVVETAPVLGVVNYFMRRHRAFPR
jgi:ribosomal protein S18 acetylase RimI-like enzyme